MTSAIQDTPSDMFGGQGAGFPEKGAALSITWLHFFAPNTTLTNGMEKLH